MGNSVTTVKFTESDRHIIKHLLKKYKVKSIMALIRLGFSALLTEEIPEVPKDDRTEEMTDDPEFSD